MKVRGEDNYRVHGYISEGHPTVTAAKLCLCFNWASRHEGVSPEFPTPEVSGQLHSPQSLYPQGRDPDTHRPGRWVGPRAGGEEKNSQPTPGLEPSII
jgi:hypothetical protein